MFLLFMHKSVNVSNWICVNAFFLPFGRVSERVFLSIPLTLVWIVRTALGFAGGVFLVGIVLMNRVPQYPILWNIVLHEWSEYYFFHIFPMQAVHCKPHYVLLVCLGFVNCNTESCHSDPV